MVTVTGFDLDRLAAPAPEPPEPWKAVDPEDLPDALARGKDMARWPQASPEGPPRRLGWPADRCRAVVVSVMIPLLVAAGRPALANGAFPDSMRLLLPSDRPQEITLATNFGLFHSEDSGRTWSWSCEPDQNDVATLYEMGPPPGDRTFAILASSGLVYSDDGACTWMRAGGSLANAVATDVFPAPSDGSQVYAIAAEEGPGAGPPSVYVSSDGGATFGPSIFRAPTGGGLLGVESVQSVPMAIYLAMYTPPGTNPVLVHSTDGGAAWASIDLAPALGASSFRIIAVDSLDPLLIYLRVSDGGGEELAVSRDGGASVTEPIRVDGALTAFVRLSDGTLLVGSSLGDVAAAFRSIDDGATFEPWPGAPHLRALAERGGLLYAAADNFRDHFAAGVSTDGGATFQSLLTYDQVQGIKPCAQERCATVCAQLASNGLWDASVCAPGGRRGGGQGPGATGDTPSPDGCRCSSEPLAPERAASVIALGGIAWIATSRRRSRPPRRRDVDRPGKDRRNQDSGKLGKKCRIQHSIFM